MKKLLSIILCFTLILSLSVTAFATELDNACIEDNIEYLTIYNEENNTVQAVQRNIITNECVYGPVITIEDVAQVPQTTALGADVHQDTFLNFEYDIWYDTANGDEWNLERPGEIFSQQYFKTYQTTANYDMLRAYKSDVDDLNAAELAAIPLIGVAAFNIVKAAIVSHAAVTTGGTLTAAAIASIKTAAKATGAAAVAIGLVCSTYNDCALSFKYALNNTDNIHY